VGEALADFCYNIKLQPGRKVPSIYQSHLVYVPELKMRLDVHTAWVLPFLYGVLGSAVFLMRNLLNARTPSIGIAGSAMRLALGGTAGIVIGWFSAPMAGANPAASALYSVPFAFAFLAGFSLDMLFSRLDKVLLIANSRTPARRD
jgi:hypothetical protein